MKANEKKKEVMNNGFDRWTSNGIGQEFDKKPLTNEQKKIIEEANKKLENDKLRKVFKG